MLLDHMAQGLSFESFAGRDEVAVSKQTLYDWLEKHSEFVDAKGLGTERCRLFWEKLGIAGAAGRLPNYNNAAYIFNIKNRFPAEWRDRHELIASSAALAEIGRDDVNKALAADKFLTIDIDPPKEEP